MPAISVIVPTRGRNHLLPRCLRSVYAQTFRDFEILLVDDNPPESRLARDASLNGFLADGRLRVIENPAPRNAATARNCALREARGEWMTYLDDDDAYHPAKLQKQFERVNEEGVPLACCGLTYRLARRSRTRHVARSEFSGDELLLDFPAMPAIFHRRTDVLFSESLPAGEDLYFFHELLHRFRIDRMCNVPEALVDVYPQPDGRVSLNADAVWQASVAVCRDFGGQYSKAALQIFMLRARLAYCKVRGGMLAESLSASWQLARLHGRKDARFILGSLLFQFPPLRRFLVS